MSNQRELEEVRRRLAAFAATIPGHGLEQFGELVEIEAVQTECVYLVTLETEYEERTLLRKEQPNNGQGDSAIPVTSPVKEVNVWDSTWDKLVTQKLQGSHEYEIPGSQEVVACGQCASRGSVRCEHCKGTSEVTCPQCNGGWVRCCGCNGTGTEPSLSNLFRAT